jgi:formylglycine-generating enzyme required for sulfatase activity
MTAFASPSTAPAWQPGRAWRDGETFPQMVDLPLGVFTMGESGGDKFATDLERPRHRVEIGYPVAFGRGPVTVAEYAAYSGGSFTMAEHTLPIAGVNWNDARAYCEWLSLRTGRAYRLPTEAEWEYACSAGGGSAFPNGDTLTPADANFWYDENGQKVGPGRRTPVGSYPVNPFGLHDMIGNVCEWVADAWHPHFRGAPEEGEGWAGEGLLRVIRGGAWDYLPRLLRSRWRDFLEENTRRDNVGFRVACTVA